MRPKAVGAATGLGMIALLAGCEDKSLAMDAANLGNLRQVRESLACRAPDYPDQLRELGATKGACPPVEWVQQAKAEPAGLRYAGYVWAYKRVSISGRNGFEVEAISRPVRPEGCPDCRSYWLDESQAIRWAQRRRAQAVDPELAR